MKVKDLIAILAGVDPELDIVMSSDPEGNDYYLWGGNWADDMVYEGKWALDIGYPIITKDLEEEGFGEEDAMPDGTPCFIIWPS